jgi:hypothetical protein
MDTATNCIDVERRSAMSIYYDTIINENSYNPSFAVFNFAAV